MANPPGKIVVPQDIALQLPPLDLLHAVLSANILTLPAGTPIYRAAWVSDAVWPVKVLRAYRFGPPQELLLEGVFPYFWVYASAHPFTAAWEAELCQNPATVPGKFIIAPRADQALIATLHFGQPLRLLDLTGEAASKLGIYDQLHHPNYTWSQWFGWQLDQVVALHQGAVHGICYPSRKHLGHTAFAISSRVQASLADILTQSTQRFEDSNLFAQLLRDPCRVDHQMV